VGWLEPGGGGKKKKKGKPSTPTVPQKHKKNPTDLAVRGRKRPLHHCFDDKKKRKGGCVESPRNPQKEKRDVNIGKKGGKRGKTRS